MQPRSPQHCLLSYHHQFPHTPHSACCRVCSISTHQKPQAPADGLSGLRFAQTSQSSAFKTRLKPWDTVELQLFPFQPNEIWSGRPKETKLVLGFGFFSPRNVTNSWGLKQGTDHTEYTLCKTKGLRCPAWFGGACTCKQAHLGQAEVNKPR